MLCTARLSASGVFEARNASGLVRYVVRPGFKGSDKLISGLLGGG